MIRAIRAFFAVVAVAVLASCGGGDSLQPSKTYQGPPITQIVVKKADRKMYLVSGKEVVKSYKIDLGNQPFGHKQFEGDGRTPEGLYFIDRFNPRSRYHLSVGISYPSAQDVANAAMEGKMLSACRLIRSRLESGDPGTSRLQELLQETGVDEIHVADGSGVIRATTDPPSLGIDLYQFHPQLEEVSRGTRDVYATPISRKIGEDKLVKYLSIADARGTLYQVGMSVDTLLSF